MRSRPRGIAPVEPSFSQWKGPSSADERRARGSARSARSSVASVACVARVACVPRVASSVRRAARAGDAASSARAAPGRAVGVARAGRSVRDRRASPRRAGRDRVAVARPAILVARTEGLGRLRAAAPLGRVAGARRTVFVPAAPLPVRARAAGAGAAGGAGRIVASADAHLRGALLVSHTGNPSGWAPQTPIAMSQTPDVQSPSVAHEAPSGPGGAAQTPSLHRSDAHWESLWQ